MATSTVNQSDSSSGPSPAQSSRHASVYEIVTEQVIKQMENGVAPWRKPWRTEMPCNLLSQKPYRGLNVFMLATQGYESRYWLTFNQARRLGGHVKQGERATTVVFWHIGQEKITRQADGTDRKSKPFLLRYYSVFNLCQTEGIAEKLGLTTATPRVPSLEQCEQIVSAMPNRPAFEQSDRAWYRPSTDTVGMPARGLFSSAEEFYSTLFHELTHSTGHTSRVGREGIEQLNTFGSESYSKEELVAEMGAAMLCGVTGIEQATIQNSAAYLKTWIERLKSDSRLLVSAASAAQKAADYILAKTEIPETETEGVQS